VVSRGQRHASALSTSALLFFVVGYWRAKSTGWPSALLSHHQQPAKLCSCLTKPCCSIMSADDCSIMSADDCKQYVCNLVNGKFDKVENR
jgi:hypothetical protein